MGAWGHPPLMLAAWLVWAVVIAGMDWRHRRVPNVLLWPVLVLAVAVLLATGSGVWGANPASCVLGLLAGLLLTLPGYAASVLGAGDVKLAATLGFLQGWQAVLIILLFAALLLGLMGVWVVLRRFRSRSRAPVRLPAAIALSSGFVGVLLMQWGIHP